jgi:hypothetical protein
VFEAVHLIARRSVRKSSEDHCIVVLDPEAFKMAVVELEGAGFNFDLCKRNAHLISRGVKPPAPKKTGTTIAGIVFKVCTSLHWWFTVTSVGPGIS